MGSIVAPSNVITDSTNVKGFVSKKYSQKESQLWYWQIYQNQARQQAEEILFKKSHT